MYSHIFDADNVLDACRKCGEWANHDTHDISIKEIKTPYQVAEADSKATRKIEVCSECSGSNIHQQITMMIDPNNPPETIDWGDVMCDDYYYCNDCEDDCDVEYKDGK